ncbi:arginyl-tRNA synthetase [Candidatus Acidianus copahuensis]|uniref:Arginine--tRNA ligase n=1 Tax=Candidatus Acidianus copahuensis TaxID=1160895 RepID=A0A031LP93_9CREN|nr:arginine--tRNA ligase [Candidatus Acidianus copahuensis]EZQ06816.1 arginyl-tRNA synthetase [Candidatus Acidianus copahuensis]
MDVLAEAKKEMARQLSSLLNVRENIILGNIEYPPREVGDLSLPLPSVTRNFNLEVNYSGKLIRSMKRDGIFINAELNEGELFTQLFSNFTDDFGLVKVDQPRRIVVEHTSANPIHPLHIGHLRNVVIGDSLSRLLKSRGHQVNVRFYVNDGGRQVALLIYGLHKLGYPEPPPNIKKDLWLGTIYAMTNIILEIRNLSKELESTEEGYKEKIEKRDELVAIAEELREKDEKIFDLLAEEIRKDEDPEAEISKLIKSYEGGDEKVKAIVRKYVNYALEGFMESLSKLHVSFDNFDYESDLLWSGKVKDILYSAFESRAKINYKGTWALDLDDFLDDEAREQVGIPKDLEIPPLVLTRSDGTSLYTVRDIAYTLYKFSSFKADKVINVIAEQQLVPQMQLRATLYILGFPEIAKNLVHYSYGMVSLQGMKMSGRRGQYVSLDEIYEKVSSVVKTKVKEKGGVLENIDEIVNAAIRYALLSVSANKPVSFNISRVTNFEENSGPYLQYTYARAYNILAKLEGKPKLENANLSDIVEDKRKILISIAKFPEVFSSSADNLQPEAIIVYLRKLADLFNSWYDRERVLQEKDDGNRTTRIFLVKGVETVIRNGLDVLGIVSLTKM